MDFNSIGYFQFNNLMQSRVPLMLIQIEPVDLKPWYNSVVHMHLENITIQCSPEEALDIVQSKGFPKHFAIVVIDLNGDKSPSVATMIEQAGFTNSYYVKGGFLGISQERE